MLSQNKPLMDQKLIALYDKALYNAADKAQLKQAGYDDIVKNINAMDIDNSIKPDANTIKKDIENTAKKFADEFVKQLKDANFLETISNEIDGHVKAVANGLIITMLPQGLATIISPMGPCTGSMIIQNGSTANIQLI